MAVINIAGVRTVEGLVPADATFLVATADGTLTAEIPVGATPGGELGGTWAAPTVDATHSGSAHHTKYTDAEAITAVEAEPTLDLAGDLSVAAGKAASVDTINEKTLAAGVTIDGVLLKDGAIADGAVPATHSGSAHHTKYTNAEAITAVEGEATLDLTGDVTVAAAKSIGVDTINEKTLAAGVTVDGLLIKDSKIGAGLTVANADALTGGGETALHSHAAGASAALISESFYGGVQTPSGLAANDNGLQTNITTLWTLVGFANGVIIERFKRTSGGNWYPDKAAADGGISGTLTVTGMANSDYTPFFHFLDGASNYLYLFYENTSVLSCIRFNGDDLTLAGTAVTLTSFPSDIYTGNVQNAVAWDGANAKGYLGFGATTNTRVVEFTRTSATQFTAGSSFTMGASKTINGIVPSTTVSQPIISSNQTGFATNQWDRVTMAGVSQATGGREFNLSLSLGASNALNGIFCPTRIGGKLCFAMTPAIANRGITIFEVENHDLPNFAIAGV